MQPQFALPRRNIHIAGRLIHRGTPIPIQTPVMPSDPAVTLLIDGKAFTDTASAYEFKFGSDLGRDN